MNKSIKNIALESSYMSPAELRFYATDWEPNGTSNLIITDDMGQVVACLSELLFGPPLDHDRSGYTFGGVSYCYGESIGLIEDSEEVESILKNEPENVVYPLLWSDVLNSVAESPVHSRLGQLKKLISVIKKAV